VRLRLAGLACEVAATEAHIASCPDCQRELESLRPVVNRFVSWPTDVLRGTRFSTESVLGSKSPEATITRSPHSIFSGRLPS
jgi:hypothetical protein